MKAFSRINIGEKISFIIGCKNYRILVVSKKTDKPCANCTRTCAICTSFNLALQALVVSLDREILKIVAGRASCRWYGMDIHPHRQFEVVPGIIPSSTVCV